jgi:hypothetical protein
MHYGNGREAKNGDMVVLLQPKNYSGPNVIGILYNAQAGNDHCNGQLAICHGNDPCPNLKDCLHIDDVKAAFAPKPQKESAPDTKEAV